MAYKTKYISLYLKTIYYMTKFITNPYKNTCESNYYYFEIKLKLEIQYNILIGIIVS